MSREELILEIIEKVHENVQRLEAKLDEIAEEQTRQNLVVTEHERRSTTAERNLERLQEETNIRLKILEKDAQFAHNLIKIVSVAGGLLLFVSKILPFISSYLLTH